MNYNPPYAIRPNPRSRDLPWGIYDADQVMVRELQNRDRCQRMIDEWAAQYGDTVPDREPAPVGLDVHLAKTIPALRADVEAGRLDDILEALKVAEASAANRSGAIAVIERRIATLEG